MTYRRLGRVGVLLTALLLPALLSTSDTSALPASFYRDDVSRSNGAIALVGDSLTFAYWSGLPSSFVDEDWGPFQLEARSGRFTTTTSASATSGLDAVRRLRAGGFDPSVWIVALGTNDLSLTYGVPGATAALIDTMMSEIGPAHRVVWVNVYKRDSVASAVAFNDELEAATKRYPDLVIADWFSVVSAHPEWLLDDGVHNTLAGAIARNDFVAAAALTHADTPLVCDPPPTSVPQGIKAAKFDGAARALAPAVRLCRH